MELTPVAKLLQAKGIPFSSSGRDYVIKCLNPKHDDSNPSFRVDKISGLAHCFACGYKRNLFKHFGVFSAALVPVKVEKLKEKIQEIVSGTAKEVDLPKGAVPYTQSFRGISAATYKHFGAFYTHDDAAYENRIVIPIKDITDKTIAFIARHVDRNAEPRYKVFPSKTPLPCYPAIVPNTHTIVLVEGIFDMMNLYDKGLTNSVSIFGANNLTNTAQYKMLAYKAQGIHTVYLLMDGDDPGRAAAAELKPVLENLNLKTHIVELEEGQDPGGLSKKEVDVLNRMINGKSSDN